MSKEYTEYRIMDIQPNELPECGTPYPLVITYADNGDSPPDQHLTETVVVTGVTHESTSDRLVFKTIRLEGETGTENYLITLPPWRDRRDLGGRAIGTLIIYARDSDPR